MATNNLEYLDTTPPYITDVKFPNGYARNTHSTAVQFTINDDKSGLQADGLNWVGQIVEFDLTWKDSSLTGNWYNPYTLDIGEEGVKQSTQVVSSDTLYKLSATKLRIRITLRDVLGNERKEIIESEPTIPYEPMLTEGVGQNQTLDNLKGSQLAATNNSTTAYLMSIAGNGKAIYYSGPSAVDFVSGEGVEKSEYRINGWVADSDTELEGFYQYNVTLSKKYGSILSGANHPTKVTYRKSHTTKYNVTYKGNSFKVCHIKGSEKYISKTNLQSPIDYNIKTRICNDRSII